MAKLVAICAVLAVVVTVTAPLSGAVRVPAGASAAEQNCDIGKLIACKLAMTDGRTPLESCCSNLKEQDGSCFCRYQNDPAYSQYLSNPNVPKTFVSCGVALPICS
uniref:Uncharacterized protein n=1 Tax=Avena sativa TaxID=4498 RepID=A0ACD5Z4A6_AVESA